MATVKFNGKQYPVLDYSEVGANKECFFKFKDKIFYRNGNAVTPITDTHCKLPETKKHISAIKARQAKNAEKMTAKAMSR